ncbi:MAG: hypothetical protein GVY15_10595 [Bacteroidetes bacterium]|jgi:uncharacterized protein YfiM (DUF2279 family)|nr:hypothetical protein [Bacteroidota bacterium]
MVFFVMVGLPDAQAAPRENQQDQPSYMAAQDSSLASRAQLSPPSAPALRAALLYGRRTGRPSNRYLPAQERADPWVSYDKVQHVTFSALFAVGGQYGLENKLKWARGSALPVSTGAAMAIGIGKELYDWRLGSQRFFSYRDIVANGFGVLLATGFILL